MRGHPVSTTAERMVWLLAHPEVRGLSTRAVIDAMKRDGLLAPSTYWKDVAAAIDRLRKEALK